MRLKIAILRQKFHQISVFACCTFLLSSFLYLNSRGPSTRSYFIRNNKTLKLVAETCKSEKWKSLVRSQLSVDWNALGTKKPLQLTLSARSSAYYNSTIFFNREKLRASQFGVTFVVSEKHKLLYCFNFKAASSSFRKFISAVNLAGTGKTNEGLLMYNVELMDEAGLFLLDSYNRGQVEAIFTNYTKITLVRNPFLRVMSTWHMFARETFSTPKLAPFKEQLMRGIRPAELPRKGIANFLTLEEYFEYIIAEANGQVEPKNRHWLRLHWNRQADGCRHCLIKYDYIANVETMSQDLPVVMVAATNLTQQAVPAVRQEPRPTRGLSAQDYYAEAGRLPRQLVEELLRVYAIDYEMFGYDFQADLKLIFDAS